MKLIDLALAAVCAAALGVTAFMLAGSWGGTSWLLDVLAGVAVVVLVVLRSPWSIAVALAAVAVARVADQPQEPGPAAALALAFLVAWAVPRGAWWVPAGGLAVVAATWASALPDEHGFTPVTVIDAALWGLGLGAGLVARFSGTSGGGGAASRRRPAPAAGAAAGAGADPAR
ncbi:hypothetical protein ACPPVO_11995 [Dactylosporangium sp. McL0621]|uniref:hypothetical protein n=1 Tax=Dactylosporangium sp. McL0621 TaxID=3415678 RepID=UPI003CF91CF2